MKKFITLVAVDFSKSSYVVLEKALEFTNKMNGELHVIHVVEDSFFSKKTNLDSIESNGFNEINEKFNSILKDNFHCLIGKIKVAVGNMAKDLKADMIIMGHSGETHFLNEFLMGSHTKEIINHTQTPVLVIKREHKIEYKDILVLSDQSKASDEAIKKIVKIFPNSNIKLVTLYYLPIDNMLSRHGSTPKGIKEYQASVKKESEKSIDSFLKSLALPKEIKITASAISSSLNPKEFKKEVANINYNLLAIHRTQNVSFFAFDILEQSDVDVLVLK